MLNMLYTFCVLFSIDQEIVNRVDIVTPGYLSSYDRETLEVQINFHSIWPKTLCFVLLFAIKLKSNHFISYLLNL